MLPSWLLKAGLYFAFSSAMRAVSFLLGSIRILDPPPLSDAEPDRVRAMLKALFVWEATVEHPRWHTGTFWTQEDVRRYSADHVRAENEKEKKAIFGQ